MCIAIYKPADKFVDWEDMREAERCNSDGWGFAVRLPEGRLLARRGLSGYQGFREAFEPFARFQAIIHFRIRTHGAVKLGNCHPFMVSKSLAVIHNGMINIDQNVNAKRSDTWHFNELVLRQFYAARKDFWRHSAYKFVIEQMSYNKFVFLSAGGGHAIYNESEGHWAGGIWYSNRSYQRSSVGFGHCSREAYYAYGSDGGRYERYWDRLERERAKRRGDSIVIGRRQDRAPETSTPPAPAEKERQLILVSDDVVADTPASTDDALSPVELARQEFDRQTAELQAASQSEEQAAVDETTELEEERVGQLEEERAAMLASRLIDEGCGESTITEIHDIFGNEGLEALVDLLPEGM